MCHTFWRLHFLVRQKYVWKVIDESSNISTSFVTELCFEKDWTNCEHIWYMKSCGNECNKSIKPLPSFVFLIYHFNKSIINGWIDLENYILFLILQHNKFFVHTGTRHIQRLINIERFFLINTFQILLSNVITRCVYWSLLFCIDVFE